MYLMTQSFIYIYIYPYLYRMVIFNICMSLFESTLFSFCKLQGKLDIPTLRQGSKEGKNAKSQINNMTITTNIYIYM